MYYFHKKLVRTILLSLTLMSVMVSCTHGKAYAADVPVIEFPDSLPVCEPLPEQEPEAISNPWTDEELDAIARTLAGECYEHKAQDKRRVCEVILNRVSDGRFGSSVVEVLTAKNQFNGYWVQSRSVSENDYEVAAQALKEWYDGGCKALSEYLFFCAGSNQENQFRSEF